MLAEIAMSLTSLKAAKDIAHGLVSLREEVAVKLKVAELLGLIADVQGGLNDAQMRISDLQGELRAANERLARRAAFDRYEEFQPFPGTVIYRLKESELQAGAEQHFICPVCREDDVRAFLRNDITVAVVLTCSKCERNYVVREYPGMNSTRKSRPRAGY